MHAIFINLDYVYAINSGILKDQVTIKAIQTLIGKSFWLNIFKDKINIRTIKTIDEFKIFLEDINNNKIEQIF